MKPRETQTITIEHRCPKCNGLTLELDPEGDIHCWACGSTFIGGKVEGKPRQRRGRNVMHLPANRKHDYVEKHKDEIIADLLSLGRPLTCSKWDISQSTIHVFEKKHLTQQQKDEITKIGIEKGSKHKPKRQDNGQMPPLPRFKDTWDVSVQLKWLEVYETLGMRKRENESINKRELP